MNFCTKFLRLWRFTLILSFVFASKQIYAANAPSCDDLRVISDIRIVYGEFAKSLAKLKSLHEIRTRETFFGEYGISFKARNIKIRSNEEVIWSTSRYCIATIKLESNEIDILYYKIDGKKDDLDPIFAFTPCSEMYVKYLSIGEPEEFNCTPFQWPVFYFPK